MDIAGKLWTKVRKNLSPPKTIPRIVDAGDFFCAARRVRSLAGLTKCEGILDAAGGAQHLLANFSLITITKYERILDAAGGQQHLISAPRLPSLPPVQHSKPSKIRGMVLLFGKVRSFFEADVQDKCWLKNKRYGPNCEARSPCKP